MYRFFCLRGTCYIYMSYRVGPVARCGCAADRKTVSPKKANPLAPAGPKSNKKEECDGTHANRPETRIFQRRATESGHHWLRLRWLAAGAALCRSGAQSHGI